ncbi:MAG: helix-turn-helix domain-containing protein [Candidatus Marinimicrobia bacterium]|nr:helix-turn-helix domain-containing protein [Candidatus Neomarinimicrobiota bacterium]
MEKKYMSPDLKYFTSQEVSNILGVHVSTIKRWTEQGELDCVRTAGGHRKFLFNHVADFLDRHEDKISQAHLFPIETEKDLEVSYHILKGDFEFLREEVLEMALNRERDMIQQILNGLYLGQYELHAIYDRLLTPVLYEIGRLWEEEKISVIEEHIGSQTIRDGIIRLQGGITIPSKKIGSALCVTLSTELHDIALKMVDHILEEKGFNILFSGQLTPMYNVDKVLAKFDVDRVYLSSTYNQDTNMAQFELNYLLDQCESHNVDLYIGGNGFDKLSYNPDKIKGRLYSFRDVFES